MPPHQHGERDWSRSLRLVSVRFEFTHPTATTVAIAGTFNNWHPTTKSMHPAGGGLWLKEAFLPPGNYEYCLVVDGHCMPDPAAKEQVPNAFGGRNSVLQVASSPEAAHRAEATSSPLKNAAHPRRNRQP